MKVLIRSPNWLGDAVMAFPLVQVLKENLPNISIHLMTRSYLAELWEVHSAVDKIRVIKGKGGKLREISMALKMRKEAFDVYISLPNSFLAALSGWLSGAKRRIGFATQRRAFLLTHPLPLPQKEHRVFQYLKLLKPLNINAPYLPPLRLTIDHSLKEKIKYFLKGENGPFVALNPGAFYGEAKCWPEENFIELGRSLVKKGFQVVLLGSKKETERNKRIKNNIGKTVKDFTGKTSLKELMAVLTEMKCLVTNDTGTMHLAVLLDVPVVAIFGSTSPTFTGPWKGKSIVLSSSVPCSPCFKRKCPKRDLKCMQEITVEQVLSAVLRIVNESKS